MKITRQFIHLILVPLMVLIYILCGFYAAALSAVIEFETIRALFTSAFIELISPAFAAGTLVFSFEFTKIFLHFFKARCLAKKLPLPRLIPHLLRSLVALSLTCSMIFTVSTLNRASYNEEQLISQTRAIEETLNLDIAAKTAEYQEQYEHEMKPYITSVESAQQALADAAVAGMGPKTSAAVLSALQASLDTANRNYDTAVEKFSAVRDANIEKATKDLTGKAEADIQKLWDTRTEKAAARFDNPLLSNFLLALAETLFHMEIYSRSAYLWFSLLLGGTVSILLELLISSSTGLLAQGTDFLFDQVEGVSEQIRTICDELVLTLFKAFSALAVYLAIMSFYYTDFSKEQLLSALSALGVSFFLVKHFPSDDEKDASLSSEHIIYAQVRDCILQGVVSFMGYILLGFVFGQEAITLDLSTVAIGIGATVSGGISSLPKFLQAQSSTAA